MINLLPPKRLLNIRVARNNTVLRRYVELALASIIVLAVSVGFSYYFLSSQQDDVKKTNELTQSKSEELKPVQKQAEELSASVNTISSLLSRNIKFSELLTQIGGLMPEGSVLTGLQFSIEDLESPLVVSAQIENESTAAVLRSNLASSPLFKDVTIKSITQNENKELIPTDKPEESAEQEQKYKYTTVINTFFKDLSGKKK